MRSISEILGKYLPQDGKITAYQEALVRCARVTGETFYVMHTRVEAGFGIMEVDKFLPLLHGWAQEAEKSDIPGLTFNNRFKQFRSRE